MDERPQHPSHDPADERAAARGSLGGRHLAAIAGVALGILFVGMWFLLRTPREPADDARAPAPARTLEGSRAVTLYFAGADEPMIYTETREVGVGRRFDEQVRQVIDALIAGPDEERGVSAIPAGTQLLAVSFDPDAAALYLDFSAELVAAHPGGSAAEYCTVAVIVRTVGENFPEVRAVQLLVDGSQVDTIAGHIRADEPFLVRDWR
ncbi:MAG TPA: GerMN domain-containing protein [Candidatus Krumholzibacteria bacterium]|nr:GerMN domain-containing protein [Candidatus Krumholzibacteria bacterium]